MAKKNQIEPGEKLPLKLTASERKLVLEETLFLEKEPEQIIGQTPAGKPIMMSLDDLDDLVGHLAAAANHCQDGKKRKKLDAVFKKIEGLLEEYTDEEPPRTIKIEDARKAAAISDPALQIATWAAQVLVAAENLGSRKGRSNISSLHLLNVMSCCWCLESRSPSRTSWRKHRT